MSFEDTNSFFGRAPDVMDIRLVARLGDTEPERDFDVFRASLRKSGGSSYNDAEHPRDQERLET